MSYCHVVLSQVYVPQDLASPDCLTRAVDYNSQVGIASDVKAEGDGMQTLAQLRDAVVEAAKAEGRITESAPASEFLLRVTLDCTSCV